MTSRDELRSMVMQFKVSDLQLLLGFAGQNKNGRKSELQKKAMNLITNKMSVPLEMKIRHLYRQTLVENETLNSHPAYSGNYDYNCYRNGYSSQSVLNNGYDNCNSNYQNHDNHRYYDDWSRKHNNYSSYSQSQNFSIPSASEISRCNINEPFMKNIPDRQKLTNIVFKKLSFYTYKSDISPLTPMVPKVKHSDSFEYTATFTLNPAQHSLISWGRKNDKESRYLIQLRMCELSDALDSHNEVEVSDSLPLALAVRVNDKGCQLPPAIPSTNKQGMLLKRMNAPINLTPQSRKNHVNNISINWSVGSDRLFGVAIHLVEKFTSDELIDKLKEKGERDPEITKKYLNDKLNGDDDIAATSLKVSLICPLGKIMLSLPTRASTCNHLQCFDGSLYVKMNEVKSTWQCPVCNQTCYYEDLFIDGFFTNVLKSGACKPNVTEIQINADGSVVPVLQKKRTSSTSSKVVKQKKKRKTDAREESRSSEDNSKAETEERRFSSEDKCEESLQQPNRNVQNDIDQIPSLPFFVPLFSSKSSSSETLSNPGYPSTDWRVKSHEEYIVSEDATSESNDNKIKKNVVLVDLTESDSESEESKYNNNVPLNLKKARDNGPVVSEQSCKKLPPVYDIDDADYI